MVANKRSRARARRPRRVTTKLDIQLVTVILWVLIGVAAIFGLQPWMRIGEIAVGHIHVIPFVSLMSKIPILNGIFFWLEDIANSTAVSVVAVSLCLAINLTQVVGGLHVSKLQWAVRIIGGAFEVFVSVYYHAPYDGGIAAIAADFPYLDPYYLNIPGAIMTVVSVLLFETLFLYGFEYIKAMKAQQMEAATNAQS